MISAAPRADARAERRSLDREIRRLAVPAFLALIAEPIYLLADAAIIGHLGTGPLAGLGIAGAILQTIVGLCIFLAYGTTAAVARLLGAGDLRGALGQGMDGVWLAVAIGSVATLGGLAALGPLVGAFGAEAATEAYARDYLVWALPGVIPLLVVLAGTGVLRGLQDTRTPLYVAVGGNLLNIVLSLALVHGVGLGIAGAAIGTVIAQTLAATALVVVVVRAARREGARLAPHPRGIARAARVGTPLLIRTLTLRAALLITTVVATGAGTTSLAAHQLAMTLWGLLAFALDAVAIAAQAITGRALGAGESAYARRITRRMVRWGVWSGLATGLLLAAVAPVIGPAFSRDPAVHAALVPVLLVAALGPPVAGVVFVLDGVLIGAGDGTYLAWAGLVVLLAFAPLAWLSPGLPLPELVALWAVFVLVLMGGRAVVLLLRARGDAWMRTGPASTRS